jgi:serine/threonine-protein kinase
MNSIHGYQLTQWLGAGGMGEVYRAYHPATGRTVALKILNRPDLAERFRNEARIQAGLQHPHIAAVHEFFVEGGTACLVMEYVDGTALDGVLRRQGAFAEATALGLFAQAVSAVAYLHRRGICHRDLKLSNFKLVRSGETRSGEIRPGTLKLLDFGIAKSGDTPKLTREGHLVGTARSMAPEQFDGNVGPPADCWALGVLLYELLTGHPPFDGRTEAEIGQKVKRGEYLAASVLKPGLSKPTERLIARLLTGFAPKRYTAEQALAALENPALLNESDWIGTVKRWVGKG